MRLVEVLISEARRQFAHVQHPKLLGGLGIFEPLEELDQERQRMLLLVGMLLLRIRTLLARFREPQVPRAVRRVDAPCTLATKLRAPSPKLHVDEAPPPLLLLLTPVAFGEAHPHEPLRIVRVVELGVAEAKHDRQDGDAWLEDDRHRPADCNLVVVFQSVPELLHLATSIPVVRPHLVISKRLAPIFFSVDKVGLPIELANPYRSSAAPLKRPQRVQHLQIGVRFIEPEYAPRAAAHHRDVVLIVLVAAPFAVGGVLTGLLRRTASLLISPPCRPPGRSPRFGHRVIVNQLETLSEILAGLCCLVCRQKCVVIV
mmetsp:Transcript_6845/g.22599  ORF Transcript_6845/g.22599 Transcript_6845/m.22599 type:complete len:315 (+) Transcript_6845:152-1096(+)